MKKILLIPVLLGTLVLTGCGKNEQPSRKNPPTDFDLVMGMDLSFQPELKDAEFAFKDASGTTIDMLPFLQSKGVDLVRLRLWNDPEDGRSGLDEVLAYSQEVHDAGLDILLDFHYSDWWADPGNQTIPTAWAELNHQEMVDAIYDYTHEVLSAMKTQGTLPKMVQIGNETNSGFLWNIGRIGGAFENNWPNFLELMSSAISAVREVDPGIEIMLHFAGLEGASWFFTGVNALDYDIIGLSYYSIWHGKSLTSLSIGLSGLANNHNKPIMIVETAYPWTLGWNDWTNNIWGEQGQLISGYPATPQGQRDFLAALKDVVANIPNGLGYGICWWAPDWVAYKGEEAPDGSSWENATLFNFEGRALPAIEEFAH